MITFVAGFIVSLVGTLLVLRYKHLHNHVTADFDLKGVQKFHVTPVPRIGGIGIMLGFIFSLSLELLREPKIAEFGLLIVVAATPAFLIGLMEDLTKRVGVKDRLLATLLSGALGGVLLGGWLTRLDIQGVDYLINFMPVSILLTCFAIAGVTNSFNLIDGYNGLASMVAVITLVGLSYVANQIGDREVMITSFLAIGSILGFFIWNFPRGLIFLGDGGAYLIGFLVAELSVLLVVRNQEVSPWFPALLVFYPIFETIFTLFRRILVRRVNPGLPDSAHLHQLIYRRVVLWAVGDDCLQKKTQRNSLTSPYLWVMTLLAVMPAIIFWNNTSILQLIVLIYSSFYVWIYLSIIKRKFPRWLSIRKKRRKE